MMGAGATEPIDSRFTITSEPTNHAVSTAAKMKRKGGLLVAFSWSGITPSNHSSLLFRDEVKTFLGSPPAGFLPVPRILAQGIAKQTDASALKKGG